MFATLRRVLSHLDLEDKILSAGALTGMIGVLCPWIGGEWLGGTPVLHTGFGFYTSFLGLIVFLLNGFILFVTLSPLMGGPNVIRRSQVNIVRLIAGGQAVILALASLSVLTRVAFEFSRVEIRFGIYLSMIGSLIASLYAFLKWQEERRQAAESFFRHEEPAKKADVVPSPGGGGSGRGDKRLYRIETPRIDPLPLTRTPSLEGEKPVVLKKIEVPVAMKEVRFPSPRGGGLPARTTERSGGGRGDLIEKIKEEVLASVEPSVPPTPSPPPPPKVVPKAPAIEEHPIFRSL